MSDMRRRLERLEQASPYCATCQAWHMPALVPIVTSAEARSMPTIPAACPQCYRPTPDLISIIVVPNDEE